MALGKAHLGTAGAAAALPVLLFFVLSALRPDLMQPLLQHTFGALFVAGVLALSAFSGAVLLLLFFLVDRLVPERRRVLRASSNVVAGVLVAVVLVIPTAFSVLFAPIVLAMMGGGGRTEPVEPPSWLQSYEQD